MEEVVTSEHDRHIGFKDLCFTSSAKTEASPCFLLKGVWVNKVYIHDVQLVPNFILKVSEDGLHSPVVLTVVLELHFDRVNYVPEYWDRQITVFVLELP